MLDFIVKYWLEVAFGLVCGAIAWLAKKYIAMSKTEKENHETSIIAAIQDKMDDQYDKTQKQMDACYNKLNNKISEFIEESQEADKQMMKSVNTIKSDVLTIEGAYFRSECRRLLEKDHIMTQEEFNTITLEHGAYNSLGGNHEGDMLFNMVTEKYQKQVLEK